jgi:signal transduction histidine kinase/DNA-binding response OmpR family regulator
MTPHPPAAAAPAEAGAEPRASILVVDDLTENLLVYRTVLEELGQHLVFARSGAQALREVLQHDFAVILLDVNMPDIDGFETASLVRRYRRSAHTPIIFVTSYADEMQTVRGYALGAVDFMLSPVVPEVLRTKVKVFVDLHTMQQRMRRQGDERAARMAAEAARAVAERNDQRSHFLATASRVLGESLDLALAERQLLELLVPRHADWALLVPLDREHGRGPGDALLLRADGVDGGPGGAAAPAFETLPRGRLPAVLHHALEAEPAGGAAAQALQALAPGEHWRDACLLPMANARRGVGLLLLARRTLPVDRPLLAELAARAAVAFENAALYRSLQAENAARIATEAELQNANRRKDEFLAMLSHELRNPLAPLRNALEVVRRVAPAHPKLGWAADVMGRQVQHMTRLIEELLDVARISEGKISLERAPVELRGVVEAGVETVQAAIDAAQLALRVSLPEVPVWLHGDAARLTQVVGNLLNNAAKYGRAGGRIELALSVADGQAQIAVRDDGIGIDAALLPHIFDLFVQGDRSLDRSQGGLGVGLTLVRRLVELHGGRVEASSAGVGQGAEFRVQLPILSVVPAAGRAADEQLRGEPPAGLRVLIVDDNRDAADSVAQYLELEGHEVKTAPDGPKALASVPVFAPHVVLLDIGLPGMSGHEVARRLQEWRVHTPMLLIAVTGYGQKEDRELSEDAGFDAHLVKPADPRELAQMLRQWAQERRGDAPARDQAGGIA